MVAQLLSRRWQDALEIWAKATSAEEYRRSARKLMIMYATVAIAAYALWAQPLRVVYNMTSSLPKGVYIVNTADRTAELGDIVWVTWNPPQWVRDRYHDTAIGRDWHFIKGVAAMPGEALSQDGDAITRCVDGACEVIAVRKPTDRQGRAVPELAFNESVPENKLFLTNPHPRSFDSRYVGYFDFAAVRGIAYPLWTQPANYEDEPVNNDFPAIPEGDIAELAMGYSDSEGGSN